MLLLWIGPFEWKDMPWLVKALSIITAPLWAPVFLALSLIAWCRRP